MSASTVLIVDHDCDRRKRLATLFKEAGFLPVALESGRMARQAVRTAAAVGIYLRLDLPGLDHRSLESALEPEPVTPESLTAVERRHIEGVLRHTGGNRSRAATLLGISRSTLIAKIRRYDIEG